MCAARPSGVSGGEPGTLTSLPDGPSTSRTLLCAQGLHARVPTLVGSLGALGHRDAERRLEGERGLRAGA